MKLTSHAIAVQQTSLKAIRGLLVIVMSIGRQDEHHDLVFKDTVNHAVLLCQLPAPTSFGFTGSADFPGWQVQANQE